MTAMDVDTRAGAQDRRGRVRARSSVEDPGPTSETLAHMIQADQPGDKAPDIIRHAHALLKVLTEVASEGDKKSRGMPSPTAYFALLVQSLQQHKEKGEDPTVTSAALYLLARTLNSVSPNVARVKFHPTSAVLVDFIQNHQNAAVVRHSLDCMTRLLELQEPKRWSSDSHAIKAFQTMVTLCIDARHKLRKKAQTSVLAVVRQPGVTRSNHSALANLAKFLTRLFGDTTPKSMQPLLHACNFVPAVLDTLPATLVSDVLQRLLQLGRLGNAALTDTALSAMHEFFTTFEGDQLNTDVIVSILGHLLDLKLIKGNHALSGRYAQCLSQVYIALCAQDPRRGAKKLPRGWNTILANFSTDSDSLHLVSAESLKDLINECISDDMVQAAAEYAQAEAVADPNLNLGKTSTEIPLVVMVRNLENCLQFKFKQSWEYVLLLIAALYERCGPASASIMASITKVLGPLHDSTDFPCEQELHIAVGSAISSMGPQAFLDHLPLGLEAVAEDYEGDNKVTREWLLPLLQQNITGTQLGFFAEYFLPLAAVVRARLDLLAPDHTLYKDLQTIQLQLWSLFPSFCNGPTDIPAAFPQLARDLGAALQASEGDDIGQGISTHVCNGLNRLLRNVRAVALGNEAPPDASFTAMSRPQAGQAQQVIAGFAHNFLPILFNKFCDTPASYRSHYALCIEAYAAVAPPPLVNQFFKTVLKSMLEHSRPITSTGDHAADVAEEKKRSDIVCNMNDLALSLAVNIDHESLNLLYRAINPQLSDPNPTLQKKGYKVLERMLHNRHATAFVGEHIDALREVLLDAITTCTAGAKKMRLRCIQVLASKLTPQALLQFVPQVIGEVILCTKEANAEARNAAFDVVVELGYSLCGTSSAIAGGHPESLQVAHGDCDNVLNEYLIMVIAGLGGTTPHMISATVMVLSRLLYEFRFHLQGLQKDLIEAVLILLQHKAREIVRAVIGFAKVIVVELEAEDLGPHIPNLVSGLLSWASDSKNHFRLKIKVIFERLLRKFDYDLLEMVVPEEDRKFLANIRKANARQRRNKDKAKNEGDQDATMTDTTAGQGQGKNGGVLSNKERQRAKEKRQRDFEKLVDDDDKGADGDELGPDREWLDALAQRHVSRTGSTGKDLDGAEVMDMLDKSGLGRQLAQRRAQGPGSRGKFKGTEHKLDDLGRVVVPNETPTRKKKRGRSNTDDEDVEGTTGTWYKDAGGIVHGEDEEDDDDGEDGRASKKRRNADGSASKARNNGGVPRTWQSALQSRRLKARQDRQSKPDGRMTGAEFRSKKKNARGDVRRKGAKLEPYAYIPLDPANLNYRKRPHTSTTKAVNSVISAARKGASKARKKRR